VVLRMPYSAERKMMHLVHNVRHGLGVPLTTARFSANKLAVIESRLFRANGRTIQLRISNERHANVLAAA